MDKYGAWCITRYEDVRSVLRDPKIFSSEITAGVPPVPAEFAEELPNGYPQEVVITSYDPPEHTRLRKVAQRAMAPKVVRAHEPVMRDIAHRLIDRFVDEQRVDLVEVFSFAMPTMVITSLLGAPLTDADRFQKWTADTLRLFEAPTPHPGAVDDALRELTVSSIELDRYVRRLIEEVRANPQSRGEGDALSALIDACDNPRPGEPTLDDKELLGTVSVLLVGGLETTAGMISNMTFELLRDRDRWEELVRDPSLIPAAIEEFLRLRGSVTGMFRKTTTDVELGGVSIPAGASLYCLLPAANTDPEMFPDPETYDPRRPNIKEHLGLGRWTHFCLGAPIARAELRIAMEVLIERLPNLQLVQDQELTFAESLLTPTMESLKVVVR